MEIEYEVTGDDFYAFQWRAAHKSPIARRTRRDVYLYLLLAFLLIGIVPAIGRDGFVASRISFGFVLIGYPLMAGLTWLFDKRGTRSVIKQLMKEEKPNRGILGRHRLVLDSTGLVESTDVNESRFSWKGVDRIEEDESYIFIYTTPSAAHIVPRRAFGSTDKAQEFYEFARANKQSAG